MTFSKHVVLAATVVAAFLTHPVVQAQVLVGTEFTYQGQLDDKGSPANGNFDMSFRLFNAVAGGSQIGATQSANGVEVNNGSFAVELDFGNMAFNGDVRWLELTIEGTLLSPRQKITATPYATYSASTRGVEVNSGGTFVGVGRNAPFDATEVFGIEAQTSPGPGNFGGMYVRSTGSLSNAYYGYDSGGLFSGRHWLDGVLGSWRLESTSAGGTSELIRVSPQGVFRAAPADPGGYDIDIASGDVRLGSEGGGNWRFNFMDDGYVGLMRDTPVDDVSWFDVQTPAGANQFGGMHVATDSEGGIPYYGYAAGGTTDVFTFYNGGTSDWGLRAGFTTPFNIKTSTGRVGLSTTTPTALLDVNGSGRVRTNMDIDLSLDVGQNLVVGGNAFKPGGGLWSVLSDRRLKKNVQDLKGTLNKLLSLRGVTFEYIDPQAINELDGERIGMIAQEVEKVFPDWVEERGNGYKMITVRGFEALTVEALRELRAENVSQIQDLEEKNADLRARLDALETAVANLSSN